MFPQPGFKVLLTIQLLGIYMCCEAWRMSPDLAILYTVLLNGHQNTDYINIELNVCRTTGHALKRKRAPTLR